MIPDSDHARTVEGGRMRHMNNVAHKCDPSVDPCDACLRDACAAQLGLRVVEILTSGPRFADDAARIREHREIEAEWARLGFLAPRETEGKQS